MQEAPHNSRKSTELLFTSCPTKLTFSRQSLSAGLGKALLKDALLRTAQAADIAGIRALLVHAKDDPARQWYLHWEFEPSPSDPFHLFLLMKDIKAMVGKA